MDHPDSQDELDTDYFARNASVFLFQDQVETAIVHLKRLPGLKVVIVHEEHNPDSDGESTTGIPVSPAIIRRLEKALPGVARVGIAHP